MSTFVQCFSHRCRTHSCLLNQHSADHEHPSCHSLPLYSCSSYFHPHWDWRVSLTSHISYIKHWRWIKSHMCCDQKVLPLMVQDFFSEQVAVSPQGLVQGMLLFQCGAVDRWGRHHRGNRWLCIFWLSAAFLIDHLWIKSFALRISNKSKVSYK